jgi:hypothetical protein
LVLVAKGRLWCACGGQTCRGDCESVVRIEAFFLSQREKEIAEMIRSSVPVIAHVCSISI